MTTPVATIRMITARRGYHLHDGRELPTTVFAGVAGLLTTLIQLMRTTIGTCRMITAGTTHQLANIGELPAAVFTITACHRSICRLVVLLAKERRDEITCILYSAVNTAFLYVTINKSFCEISKKSHSRNFFSLVKQSVLYRLQSYIFSLTPPRLNVLCRNYAGQPRAHLFITKTRNLLSIREIVSLVPLEVNIKV